MCHRVAGVWQKTWQVLPKPVFRFLGLGKTSKMSLMIELSLPPSISQRSFEASFWCSSLCHLVHWLCFACFATFLLLSSGLSVSLCHVGLLMLNPKLPLPYCTLPTISHCLRVDFVSYTTLDGFLFSAFIMGTTGYIVVSWVFFKFYVGFSFNVSSICTYSVSQLFSFVRMLCTYPDVTRCNLSCK